MFLYPNAIEDGLMNMARDWLLFDQADSPSFRHYQWSSMETSFGYGQDWEWVEEITGISVDQLIRRPTGGGIVKHGKDWTYCLVIPRTHQSFFIQPLDFYKEVHLCIASAFARQHIVTTLQPCPTNKEKMIPGDCFQEPVGWDLMNVDFSKKVAGAAMKKSRKGLLLQGTILIDKTWALNKQKFQESLTHCLADMVEEKIERANWTSKFSNQMEKLHQQFSSLDWKKKRIRS